MYICRICGLAKAEGGFYGSELSRDSKRCKECMRAESANWRRKNRELHRKNSREYYHTNRGIRRSKNKLLVETYKKENSRRIKHIKEESGCIDCGVRDYRVLQFDHVIGTKKNAVSNILGLSWPTVKKEIDKCVVRCANCHSIKTFVERGYKDYS